MRMRGTAVHNRVRLMLAAMMFLGATALATGQQSGAGTNIPGGSGLPVPRFVSLKSDRVNMRKGPGTDYPTAWVYRRAGLPLEVIKEFEGWRQVRDADGVRRKYGVEPALIPDWLALVGDAQDGYPGIPGIGRATAARLLNQYGPIEALPANVLGDARERALLFKTLATLRTDAPLFQDVDELRWRGPTPAFTGWVDRLGDPRLADRTLKAWNPLL